MLKLNTHTKLIPENTMKEELSALHDDDLGFRAQQHISPTDPIRRIHLVQPPTTGTGNTASKLESHWALLKLDRGRQLVIGSLYRPPRYTVAALQDDFADLETQLQRVLIDFPGIPLIICGDLNCDWFKDRGDPSSAPSINPVTTPTLQISAQYPSSRPSQKSLSASSTSSSTATLPATISFHPVNTVFGHTTPRKPRFCPSPTKSCPPPIGGRFQCCALSI